MTLPLFLWRHLVSPERTAEFWQQGRRRGLRTLQCAWWLLLNPCIFSLPVPCPTTPLFLCGWRPSGCFYWVEGEDGERTWGQLLFLPVSSPNLDPEPHCLFLQNLALPRTELAKGLGRWVFGYLGFNFLHFARLVITPPPDVYLYKLCWNLRAA